MITLAESCDFVAVATGAHAAPTAVVRAGAIVEPEDALETFAAPDEVEVAGGEKFGSGFGYGCEDLFGSALLPFTVEAKRAAFAGRKFQVVLRFGEEGVEVRQFCALACFSGFNQSADCFAQVSDCVKQGGGF